MSLYTTTQLARYGLVSFWELAETSGTTAADAGPGANPGTYTGTPATNYSLNQSGLLVPGGDQTPSVLFNATNGGYVSVPHNSNLNGTSGMTAEIVFQPTALSASHPLVSKMNVSVLGWYMDVTSAGALQAFAGGTHADTAAGSVVVGKTYHAAMTWSTNGDVFVYLNGVQVTGFPSTTVVATTDPVRIATDVFGQFFKGYLQYASFYNRVLSVGEIATDAAIVALSFPPHKVDSTLQLGGGLIDNRTIVADANYSAKATNRVIAYTSITAARTVTPPAASLLMAGQRFLLKDESGSCSGTNTITWAGTTDGAASTPVLNSAYARAEMMWTGTAWSRVG